MRRYLALILGFTCCFARAEPRFALEVEMHPRQLIPIARFFDYDQPRTQQRVRGHLGNVWLPEQAPILTVESLEHIPSSLREQLIEGVDLTSAPTPRLVIPSEKKEPEKPSPLIGLNGRSLRENISGLVGADGRPLKRLSGMELVQSRWKHEWDKMPDSLRRSVVPLNVLPNDSKAKLLMALLAQNIAPNLRASVSAGDSDLLSLLKETRYHRDLEMLEIKDKSPSADKGALLAKWKKITAAVNSDLLQREPFETAEGLGYHLNASQDAWPDRDLKTFVKLYNVRQLMRFTDLGKLEKALTMSQLSFDPDISQRGMVRMQGKRFEIRAHWQKLPAELEELDYLLSLPLQDALTKLRNETIKLSTPESLEKIRQRSPLAYCSVVSLTDQHFDVRRIINPTNLQNHLEDIYRLFAEEQMELLSKAQRRNLALELNKHLTDGFVEALFQRFPAATFQVTALLHSIEKEVGKKANFPVEKILSREFRPRLSSFVLGNAIISGLENGYYKRNGNILTLQPGEWLALLNRSRLPSEVPFALSRMKDQSLMYLPGALDLTVSPAKVSDRIFRRIFTDPESSQQQYDAALSLGDRLLHSTIPKLMFKAANGELPTSAYLYLLEKFKSPEWQSKVDIYAGKDAAHMKLVISRANSRGWPPPERPDLQKRDCDFSPLAHPAPGFSEVPTSSPALQY